MYSEPDLSQVFDCRRRFDTHLGALVELEKSVSELMIFQGDTDSFYSQMRLCDAAMTAAKSWSMGR